jgi:Cu/Ag efflux protein CusF
VTKVVKDCLRLDNTQQARKITRAFCGLLLALITRRCSPPPRTNRSRRTLGRTSFLLAISAIIGSDAQAGPAPAIRSPASGLRQVVHEGHAGATKASGTVDAVDTAKRKITVSHGAIKSLGWPAMTMDFAVR